MNYSVEEGKMDHFIVAVWSLSVISGVNISNENLRAEQGWRQAKSQDFSGASAVARSKN